MNEVARRLALRIRATGPISVADYMEEAGAFYYASGDPFGAAGDFITAPEISQVFGELIGLWCAELWQRLSAPNPVLLVELGPGRGTLMADALRATRNVPGFAAASHLHLIERSPSLRQMQAKTLDAFAAQWHDGIGTLPAGPMLLIANEFLDALPIRQFERHDGAWRERCVGLAANGEDLIFALAPKPSPFAAQLPATADAAVAELAPAAAALGAALGARIAREGGAALFVDYGYFPSACGDTLQAVRRHRPHEILAEPGTADLTAHVDFAAFADAARAGGAEVYGPVTQRSFLRTLGIEAREAALLSHATQAQAQTIRAGCRRLIAPDEMGTLFKVMALGQKGAPSPVGFSQDTA